MLAPAGPGALHYKTAGRLLSGCGAPDQIFSTSVRIRCASSFSAAFNSASLLAHALPKRAGIYVGHWLVPCGLCAAIAARLHAASSVGYAHGGDIALLEKLPAGPAIARFLARHLDRIAFVSQDLRQRFLALTPKISFESVVLPMGVESCAADLQARDRFLERAHGRPIVATLGRLVPLKGFDLMCPALQGLPVTWIAAGDGPERAHLERAAQAAGVDLYLAGQVNPAQREALFQVARVFALPSRAQGSRVEGTPVSLLEAAVAGVPTVANALGGIPEVAQKTGALLIPPDDPQALRAAILSILNDKSCATAMARQSAQAAQAYLWPHLAPQHLAFVRGEHATKKD